MVTASFCRSLLMSVEVEERPEKLVYWHHYWTRATISQAKIASPVTMIGPRRRTAFSTRRAAILSAPLRVSDMERRSFDLLAPGSGLGALPLRTRGRGRADCEPSVSQRERAGPGNQFGFGHFHRFRITLARISRWASLTLGLCSHGRPPLRRFPAPKTRVFLVESGR